jgi:predicted double-glycine peptidase
LGKLELSDLIERAPIIVPIDPTGYNHFVVFRGVMRNRVLLADPAYGNRTMTIEQFRRVWIEFSRIGRVGFVVERSDGLIPPNQLAPDPREFLTFQ